MREGDAVVILGFTGTSRGMTQKQLATLSYLFNELLLHVLHHGDCIGADTQAHRLARGIGASIVIHPPNNPKKRAFCVGADEIKPTFHYLVRNKHIVDHARDGIVAAPHGTNEEARSGTWATIRYARKAKRKIWIVWPDGTFKEDA